MKSDKPFKYFSNQEISATKREQTLTELVSAVKDGLNKAAGNSLAVTYEKGFKILKHLSPEMNKDIGFFFNEQDSEPIILSELRELQITDYPDKTLEAVLAIELKNTEGRLKRGAEEHFGIRLKQTEKRYHLLKRAKEYLLRIETKPMIEEGSLRRDYMLAQRDDYKASSVISKDDFKAFVLPGDRLMQMRLWHNLAPERITGVDLVYEMIDLKKQQVRFVNLQYKMWDGRFFKIDRPRELNQLLRFTSTYCDNEMCKQSKGLLPFRMPCCSAFYKPTNKKQSKDEKMITAGVHIPACVIKDRKQGNVTISKQDLYKQGLSSSVFDEMFRKGLIGSAWHSLDSLKEFYKKNKIIESDDSFVLNIREEAGHDAHGLKGYDRIRDILE